jgi:RNA polymerase sigma factor (sigma-70 family)
LTRDDLILAHLPMVGRIAGKLSHILPKSLDIQDLTAAGFVGLIQAADAYKPERGQFDHFAYYRVRGAIIDAHRRRAFQEELHESIDSWTEATLDAGNHSEFYKARFKLAELRDRAPLPEAKAAERERVRLLWSAIRDLPRDERCVLRRYLAGESANAIARQLRRPPAWTRGKLESARRQVAATLTGRQMPARPRQFAEKLAA